MGMSATQARYLSLIAQQSNLEYQGQQINQERSVLSQQVSELYNSLLAMNVPTPPSTNEFTTIQYSGVDGATNFSLGTIIPEGQNYMVEISYNAVGHSMTAQNGTLKVTPKTSDYVSATEDFASGKGITAEDRYNYYVQLSGEEEPVKIDETNVNEYFTLQEDGTYTFNGANGAQIMKGAASYTVGDGYECMTFTDAEASGQLTNNSATMKGYLEGLRHAFPECAEMDDDELKSNFMIYFTVSESGENIPHFIPKTALESSSSGVSGSNGFVTAYDYEAGGSYVNTVDQHNCQLTFDSAGRITELKIPTSTDENGEPTAFKTIKLTAETVTDEAAYQEAFAQYEYEQYKYDKEQQDINIKTEKIQEQDRTLELRLQRLDTQRTQITTELEALEKVLNDNIEKSYKTFNG